MISENLCNYTLSPNIDATLAIRRTYASHRLNTLLNRQAITPACLYALKMRQAHS